MRCLGRLITLFFLLIVAGAAWLYRDQLGRWVDARLHPSTVALRVGRPTPDALKSAMAKLTLLQRSRGDSVVLSANEMASLLAQGTSFLPGVTFDSISVELGDRSVRIRTLLDSASIPARIRSLIPGGPRHYEELTVRGELNPVHAGLAELNVEHVSVRGIPLPSDLVARFATQASGRGTDGRVEIALPATVDGFRVRPEGVAIYRQGAPR
jgi:hypothetical protein